MLFHQILNLKIFILEQFHDTAGHLDRDKTIHLIQRSFFWNNVFDDTAEYISSCIQCQRNKPTNKLPLGLLEPLKIPDSRWGSVSMDFISCLPKSNGFDTTITGRLSKMVHLIPIVKNASANDVAKLFLRHVMRLMVFLNQLSVIMMSNSPVILVRTDALTKHKLK